MRIHCTSTEGITRTPMCTVEYETLSDEFKNKFELKVSAMTTQSGFRGVHKTLTGWQTQIIFESKLVHQGTYTDLQTAALAFSIASSDDYIASSTNEARRIIESQISEGNSDFNMSSFCGKQD